MTTRIVTVLRTLIAGAGLVNAQTEDQDCRDNISNFVEFVKIKAYDDAYDPWMAVRKQCPDMNLLTYAYGDDILKHKIETASADQKETYIQDLILLYDEWLVHFPIRKGKNDKGNVLSKKGKTMVKYGVGSTKEQFDVFHTAFTEDRPSFTDPKALYLYFETHWNRFKAQEPEVTLEELFHTYEEVSERFKERKKVLAEVLDTFLVKEQEGDHLTYNEQGKRKVYQNNSKAIGQFKRKLDRKIEKVATCENLIPMYQKNFEAYKTDASWLKRAARRIDDKDCDDDALFATLVEVLHKLDPSADSAYYLYILYDRQGDAAKANMFFDQSIELEEDTYEKARKLYGRAVKYRKKGRRASSRTFARRALALQPSMGKAYLLIAKLYEESANGCGNTEFEKRSVYWLAAKMASEAGRVDASVEKSSDNLAKSYEALAPTKEMIFNEQMGGKTIPLECWIGSTVKVPEL